MMHTISRTAMWACGNTLQVHMPHAQSTSFETWWTEDRQKIDELFSDFIEGLTQQYEGEADRCPNLTDARRRHRDCERCCAG